jgi:Icc-related predicted phosphoesterase
LDQGFTLSEDRLCQIWSLIPDDTDILVTHGPPRGVLDVIRNGRGVGSTNLQNEVFGRLREKLKVHCFGHIHEDPGHVVREGIKFFNSAICDKR